MTLDDLRGHTSFNENTHPHNISIHRNLMKIGL